MKNTAALLLFPFLLLLASCATTFPTVNDLSPISPDKQFAFKSPTTDNISITFLRIKAFDGGAVWYDLYVDGTLAAKIPTGEMVILYVPAGEHIIETRHPLTKIGAPGDAVTLVTEPNKKYYYRINPKLRIVRTTEESALGAL